MNFRTIKNAITTLLDEAAAGRYQIVGFQKQTKSAEEVLDDSRMVQVYYSRGNFPEKGGNHEMVFRIDFTAAKTASGDVSAFDNPGATATQLQAALENIYQANYLADESIDELFDIICNVIMDAQNIDLGLEVGIVNNRRIDNFQKDNPLRQGSLALLTASCELSCKTYEECGGETSVTAVSIDTDISIEDDLGDNAGTEVDPTI